MTTDLPASHAFSERSYDPVNTRLDAAAAGHRYGRIHLGLRGRGIDHQESRNGHDEAGPARTYWDALFSPGALHCMQLGFRQALAARKTIDSDDVATYDIANPCCAGPRGTTVHMNHTSGTAPFAAPMKGHPEISVENIGQQIIVTRIRAARRSIDLQKNLSHGGASRVMG